MIFLKFFRTPHSPTPPLGGDRKFLLEMGGRQEWGGVGFIMVGWGLFKFSLHSWQRGANLPIVCRPTLYCLHPYFQFCLTHPLPPLPCQLQCPPPTVPSVNLFLWLNGWSCHIRCVILLNDNMDLHMSSLGTLVPEEPWCVFYATRRQVYWGLAHVVFYSYSDLISHTQTHKHTQHTQGQ